VLHRAHGQWQEAPVALSPSILLYMQNPNIF